MAQYKVPQDVEAEDKLLGPLSFRQFIYAGIALGGGALAFFMFQVFPLLAFIPLPVVFLFGVLALPLRKDQPMETYLLALLRFYLKPKLRLWNPDGTITYVEITVPKVVEQHLIKKISGQTAQERLDYLARVMDTRGWALKGVTEPTSIRADVSAEVQKANDVMDEDANLSRSIDSLIAKKDQERKESARAQMMQAGKPAPAAAQTASPTPSRAVISPARASDTNVTPLHYNPYPNSMHQKVVHTIAEQEQAAKTPIAKPNPPKPANPVPPQLSPDIMNLVRNGGLSISAIANEAHRLEDKEEVVINLHNG
ncbi:MAG TPA: PrgI family protein [Magnetospirillaceae bacterium]|nr:PrgI family protein [Magnetospirillaceae bacterium]